MSSKYALSPLWADITPIPLLDGPGPASLPALATIAYPPAYAESMSYLRAIMSANEQSPRVLLLTADIIAQNPAHYTVWLYRFKTLLSLNSDLYAELRWLDTLSLKHLKNYQIWHHRQSIMERLPSLPPGEIAFLGRILALDTKNYHVWTYRQWLCGRFAGQMLGSSAELGVTEAMIREDVRNNSAWNHRYFLVFGAEELRAGGRGRGTVVDEEIVDREVEYAKAKISMAPQNQSPWNYLRGVLRRAGRKLSEEEDFATEFVEVGDLLGEGTVRSSFAVDWLSECWAEQGELERAREGLQALARKWDPVRKGYWEYRARLLEEGSGGMG